MSPHTDRAADGVAKKRVCVGGSEDWVGRNIELEKHGTNS